MLPIFIPYAGHCHHLLIHQTFIELHLGDHQKSGPSGPTSYGTENWENRE